MKHILIIFSVFLFCFISISCTSSSSSSSTTSTDNTTTTGLFVTVGWDQEPSSPLLMESTWTSRTSGTYQNYLNGVTYGNNTFVTVGNSGTILTSPDGNSWTKRTSVTSKSLVGVTYGNGLFVTVGLGSGTHPHLF